MQVDALHGVGFGEVAAANLAVVTLDFQAVFTKCNNCPLAADGEAIRLLLMSKPRIRRSVGCGIVLVLVFVTVGCAQADPLINLNISAAADGTNFIGFAETVVITNADGTSSGSVG